jgi:hypothetical protein
MAEAGIFREFAGFFCGWWEMSARLPEAPFYPRTHREWDFSQH